MITYDGLRKKKCYVTDGTITVGSTVFPIKAIKEVENFNIRKFCMFSFVVILGLIITVPFILSIRNDILHNPNTFDRNWTIFVLSLGAIIYAFVLWIVGRDLRYIGLWVLNGTKSLLIESTDDKATVSVLLHGLQSRLLDSSHEIGPETRPKIRWTYYMAILLAIAASGCMFLLGVPYAVFLFIGFIFVLFIMRGRDIFMEIKGTYWTK